MRSAATITALAALGVAWAATPSVAQEAARQQQAMQRSMAQTQQMIQRMSRVQERAYNLGQQLVMRMEQTRARQQQTVAAEGAEGQVRAGQAAAGQAQADQAAQEQLREQNRVRTQQRLMLQMTESIGTMAGQCRSLLVQAEDLEVGDSIRDRDMERDVDQLRQRLGSMADEMESSLQIMERMNERIDQVAIAD